MLRSIVGAVFVGLLAFPIGAAPGDKAEALRYGWKQGEKYLYSVRIEAKLESGAVVLTSLNNYGCVRADGKEFWLRQRNNLIARKEDADGKSTPKILQSGLTAAARTNEIRIDPFGQVLKSSGESQLPFVLGNISMLAIVPLSPEGKDTWEVKSDCVLRESTQAAPAKPVNPKIKKKNPPPQATTTDYPAQETSTFTLGKKTGDVVVINKKYVLKTRQEQNGKPHLEFQGEGSINFDVKLGVPRSMEFKGVLKGASRSSEVPITLSYKLLEGEELEKALKIPTPPEKVAEDKKDPKNTEPAPAANGKIEWTQDLAKMAIPDSLAAGKILGKDFQVEAAKREGSGAIVLSQGKGPFPNAAILIFLKPTDPIEGKSYEIRKDTPPLQRPPIHLKIIPPGQKLPAGPAIVLDYAMKLEFSKAENGVVTGRIYACLPDENKSVVAGTFKLKLQ
jgi:hypothetical protein